MSRWRLRRAARNSEQIEGFPRRSPLASWGHHLAIDLSGGAVYWARSKRARGGLRLLEWGSVPLPHENAASEILSAIARVPWVRTSRVEVPMRSPDLRHRRIELPPLTASQAHHVGHRKVRDFLAEQPDECIGSFLRVRQSGPYPIWLAAVPANVPALFEGRWAGFGFDVYRLSSESLALGNLTRLLPPLAEGELVAVFDVYQEGGDCVVADAQGWLFSRMIPIRQARGAAQRDRPDGDADDKDEGLSQLQIERVATELGRTFLYVTRELALGRVVRLVLTGEVTHLELICDQLAESLEVEVGCVGDFVESGPAAKLPATAARAIGLALAPDPRGCSLLPAESKRRRRLRRARMRQWVALVAGGLLALGSMLTLVVRDIAGQRAIDRMSEAMGFDQHRLAIIDETAHSRERATRLERALELVQREEPPWHAMLSVVAGALPPDVALDEMRILRKGEIWQAELALEARGATVSDAASAVAQFRERLSAVPFVEVDSVGRDRHRQTIQEAERSRVFFSLRGELGTLQAKRSDSLESGATGTEPLAENETWPSE